MKPPALLFIGAAAMLGLGAVTGQPEFILPALLLVGGASFMKRAARQRDLQASLAEMDKRLTVTEGELDSASTELQQLRVEREFDRQLLRAPTPPKSPVVTPYDPAGHA